MKEKFEVIPYKSIGKIKFGMTINDLEELFGRNPDLNYKDPNLKRTNLRWDNIAIKLNKQGKVDEVSFVEGENKIFLEGKNILEDPKAMEHLNNNEKPLNTVGFKVYFKFGLAVTGFSKKKDDKSVSIFSKELIDVWKS